MKEAGIDMALVLSLEAAFQEAKIRYRDRRHLLDLAGGLSRGKAAVLRRFFNRNKKLPEEALKKAWSEEDFSLAVLRQVQRYQAKGYRVLSPFGREWSRHLNSLEPAPLYLWACGQAMSLVDQHAAVALVGSRKCSAYGQQATEALVKRLVARQQLVVSGLARGIDGHAHRAALQHGGRTAAVLPCGFDRLYPAEHRGLLEDILHQGFAISEWRPDLRAQRWHFPVRNRLISGLALAVLVMEAAERSGSLITAGAAVSQGRPVYVLPGPIHMPSYQGCLALIQDGAAPIVNFKALLEELPKPGSQEAQDFQGPRAPKKARREAAGKHGQRQDLVLQSLFHFKATDARLQAFLGLNDALFEALMARYVALGYLRKVQDSHLLTDAALSSIN